MNNSYKPLISDGSGKNLSAKVIDIDNWNRTFDALIKAENNYYEYTCKLYTENNNANNLDNIQYLHSIIMNKHILLEYISRDEQNNIIVKIIG